MSENLNDLRTPKQLARALGVSVNTVRRWLRDKQVPGYRLGGRWRASEAEARATFGLPAADGKGAAS